MVPLVSLKVQNGHLYMTICNIFCGDIHAWDKSWRIKKGTSFILCDRSDQHIWWGWLGLFSFDGLGTCTCRLPGQSGQSGLSGLAGIWLTELNEQDPILCVHRLSVIAWISCCLGRLVGMGLLLYSLVEREGWRVS